ncbi:MAG: ATP-grasp domain-containing protein, partial [Desulfobulbaceae bacterium]|nr:ATP-grasp domain-containing protein [Desulfobulbaceae bacterium]
MKSVNLLVTAVGSELACAVIKAARLTAFPVCLHGCDIREEVVGKYWCDIFRAVPSAARPEEYLKALGDMVQEFQLAAIIPTADVEFELLAFHRESFLRRFGCHILVNSLEEVRRFNDKWEAHQWYLAQGIPVPETFCADTEEAVECAVRTLGFPLVLKPRVGGGSRHIYRIDTWEALRNYLPVVPLPILQAYIFPDE